MKQDVLFVEFCFRVKNILSSQLNALCSLKTKLQKKNKNCLTFFLLVWLKLEGKIIKSIKLPFELQLSCFCSVMCLLSCDCTASNFKLQSISIRSVKKIFKRFIAYCWQHCQAHFKNSSNHFEDNNNGKYLSNACENLNNNNFKQFNDQQRVTSCALLTPQVSNSSIFMLSATVFQFKRQNKKEDILAKVI